MLSDGIKAIGTIVELTGTIVGITKEWTEKPPVANDISYVSTQVVEKLLNTPGMTQSRGTKLKKATPIFKLKDGTIVKIYRNSTGINYVFLADASGTMIFGCYVNWLYSDDLKATLSEIKTSFAASETDTTQVATQVATQTTTEPSHWWHLFRKD